MNEIVKDSLLFDFYGGLLTEKKRRVMRLYHEEDLSLAEIAEEFGISRAAVHDSLKSAERQLAAYEEKLGMVERLTRTSQAFRTIRQDLDVIEQELMPSGKSPVRDSLDRIRRTIADLDQ